ncbi:Ribonuclease h2 subunit b, partial [Globisporangium splendens]
MGKKALAVVPALGSDAKLERFHGDATDKPLYVVVTWSTSPQENGAAAMLSQMRKRQLAIVGATKKLLEMQRLQAPADGRSWFIGNDVQQDGSLMVFTPLDPLFVLLASAWHQKERFTTLYELLAQSQNTWWLQLAACNQAKIERICEVQGTGGDDTLDNLFVKANVAKILQWLRAKVTRIAATLAKQAAENAKQNTSGFDANFVLPGAPVTPEPVVLEAPTIDATKFHRDAIELIADYLSADVTDLLYQQFDLEKEVPVAPQSAASAANPHESFQRFDRRLQPETGAAASNNKRTPPSAASASKKKSKLANVDRSGMKSLTSFFTKK